MNKIDVAKEVSRLEGVKENLSSDMWVLVKKLAGTSYPSTWSQLEDAQEIGRLADKIKDAWNLKSLMQSEYLHS